MTATHYKRSSGELIAIADMSIFHVSGAIANLERPDYPADPETLAALKEWRAVLNAEHDAGRAAYERRYIPWDKLPWKEREGWIAHVKGGGQ